MRRPRWHRALSAVLALWFALIMVEPAALHACPTHSGGHAAAPRADGAPQASHAGSHAGSHVGAGHAVHAADAPPAPRHAPSGDHACTCLGDCAGGTAARVPTGPVARLALVTPTQVAPGRPQHEYVAAWGDFVLPFATAPPVALAA